MENSLTRMTWLSAALSGCWAPPPTPVPPAWIPVSSADVADCPVPDGTRLEVRMWSEEVSQAMWTSVGAEAPNDLPVVDRDPAEIARFANAWGARLGRPPSYRLEKPGFYIPDLCEVGLRLPTPEEWVSGLDEVPADVDGCALDNVADANADLTGYGPPYQQRLPCDDGYVREAPVRVFPPNAKGFRNLRGNVAEWVEQLWGPNELGEELPDGKLWARAKVAHAEGREWDASVHHKFMDAGHHTVPGVDVPLDHEGWIGEYPCEFPCDGPIEPRGYGGVTGFRLVQVNLVPSG